MVWGYMVSMVMVLRNESDGLVGYCVIDHGDKN